MLILSSSKYDNFQFLNLCFSKLDSFQSCIFLNLQYSKISHDATILKLPLTTTAQKVVDHAHKLGRWGHPVLMFLHAMSGDGRLLNNLL